jgi:choline-glycine betaine transporter
MLEVVPGRHQYAFNPLALVTSLLLLFMFLVAGADAATIVPSRMSAGGVFEPPEREEQALLGWAMATFAAILLLAGGLE